MGNHRSHTKHLPTKELFYPAFEPTTNGGENQLEGVDIDATNETAGIRVYIPHDFDALEEIVLVVNPIAPEEPMWIEVVSQYNIAGKDYNEHTEDLYFSFTAVPERIIEVDISEAVDTHPLEPSTYLNVTARRVAALPTENTDCYVVGVRIKYRYR